MNRHRTLETRFAKRGIRPAKDDLLPGIDRAVTAAESVVERLDALHQPVTRALVR